MVEKTETKTDSESESEEEGYGLFPVTTDLTEPIVRVEELLIPVRDLVSDCPATIKLEVYPNELRIYQAHGSYPSLKDFDEAWNSLPSKLDFFTDIKKS